MKGASAGYRSPKTVCWYRKTLGVVRGPVTGYDGLGPGWRFWGWVLEFCLGSRARFGSSGVGRAGLGWGFRTRFGDPALG